MIDSRAEEMLRSPLTRLAYAMQSSLTDKSARVEWTAEQIEPFLRTEQAEKPLERIDSAEGDFPRWGFTSLNLQQQFAGMYLASQGNLESVVAHLVQNGAVWHEAVTSAIGYMARNPSWLEQLLADDLPAQTDSPGWWKVWLAGQLATRSTDPALIQRVVERLVALLDHAEPLANRAAWTQCWKALSALGDPRPGLSLIAEGPGAGLPDIRWTDVVEPGEYPASLFNTIGTGSKVTHHTIERPYRLARYPLSYRQMLAYFRAIGERPRALYNPEPSTLPATRIYCTEAVEFCAWLERELRGAGLLESGWMIDLPNFAESLVGMDRFFSPDSYRSLYIHENFDLFCEWAWEKDDGRAAHEHLRSHPDDWGKICSLLCQVVFYRRRRGIFSITPTWDERIGIRLVCRQMG
ncbi:MAG: hypothetical protein JNM70_09845 [Anaerolineae bacterium]|nr:hypothetical protein [Anaerolineae bacterium]